MEEAGIAVDVGTEVVEFSFDDFQQAWHVLAGVTTANLDADRRQQAQKAVQDAMWPDPGSPRMFTNRTQFIIGSRG